MDKLHDTHKLRKGIPVLHLGAQTSEAKEKSGKMELLITYHNMKLPEAVCLTRCCPLFVICELLAKYHQRGSFIRNSTSLSSEILSPLTQT